jgi:hypothetical protein
MIDVEIRKGVVCMLDPGESIKPILLTGFAGFMFLRLCFVFDLDPMPFFGRRGVHRQISTGPTEVAHG